MKEFFKPARIAFYLLMLVVFFFVGLTVAGIIGAGKNQMLAGGAIVLGWGVLFAFFAFIAAIFISNYLKLKRIVRLNWILLVTLFILYGITHYRFLQRQKAREMKNTETHQNKATGYIPKTYPIK